MEKQYNYIKSKYTKLENNQNILDFWILVKSIIVAVANILFYNRPLYAYGLIAIEIVILLYDMIYEKWVDYFGNYVIFCGLSLEFIQLTTVTRIYSFKEFRILGINLGVITLLPLAFVAMRQFLLDGIDNKDSALCKFSKHYCLIIVASLLMGMIMIAINDNDISKISPISILIEELYQRGFQPILMIIIFLFLSTYATDEIEKISDYLLAALIGVVISMMVSLFSNNLGYYGGVSTILTCVNIRWIPILLLLPVYQRYKGRFLLILIGVAGAFLTLLYNATGKTLLIYVLIPVMYILMNFKEQKYGNALLMLMVIPVLISLLTPLISYLRSESVLFNSKFIQVVSLLSFFERKTEASAVASSPRIRIQEIINITNEYIKKPYFFLLGKGLGGTMLVGDMKFTAHAFTDLEWSSGLFFNVHESFAKLYLSNGMYGIWFFFYTIVLCLKRATKSPWILVGLYWFAISFGYSITMTAFGLSCLLYGFYESEREENVVSYGQDRYRYISAN